MKKFINRRPIISSMITVILFLVFSTVIAHIWPMPENTVSYTVYEIVNIMLPFLFVVFFGDIEVYKRKGMWDTFCAGGYMVISQIMLLLLMAFVTSLNPETEWTTLPGAMLGLLSLFGIGFREESIFRGIVVNNIAKKYITDRKGIYITAIASGVMFGLIHMTNFFSGVDVFSASIQSLVAVGGGFYLAAVYLRGGSLWALIIMHTLTDAASLFNAVFTLNNGTMIDTIDSIGLMNITPFFILTGIGLYLLRKEKCEEIIEMWSKKETL